MKSSRRVFLESAGLGSAALLATPAFPAPSAQASPIRLGICSYSFGRGVKFRDMVQSAKALNVRYINIKPEFHLPYESSAAELAEARKILDDAGIQLAGCGTAYMTKNDEAEVRSRFEYNRNLGSPLIVAGASMESVPVLEKFVKEYNIKVAIHNHGPEDKHFPTPQSVLGAVKDRDPRMGLCMDIGHTMRIGADVVASVKEAGSRMLDMHTKDIRKRPDGKWEGTAMGEGDIPLAAMFKQLEKMNFTGMCNLEYEVFLNPDGKKFTPDEMMLGMQKSLAYERGLLAGMHA
jgi:sugar phosphate isomerase/epimerase